MMAILVLPAMSIGNAATGVKFTGDTTRKFTQARKFTSWQPSGVTVSVSDCQNWAVVTTIFAPSEAVRRQSRMLDWCLVIVADKKTPVTYDIGWVKNAGWNRRVEMLSVQRQQDMDIEFAAQTPWNSFARKNVGYLFAISQGARFIWDFDDDNELIFFGSGVDKMADAPSLATVMRALQTPNIPVRDVVTTAATVNPYPVLGGGKSWPRGLPLANIQNNHNFTLTPGSIEPSTIGVLQSLAHYQPDVDAVYRLVSATPFDFVRQTTISPLMIPRGAFAPYNAQATLHTYAAFWALLLPASVNGRVSDIWRGYFAQRLFRDFQLSFGFVSRPLVVQNRNMHDYMMDFNAELPLYVQAEALIEFLNMWQTDSATLPECMEELWIELYERGFIEATDIAHLQRWLHALDANGYIFPAKKTMMPRAAAMIATTVKRAPPTRTCDAATPFRLWSSDLHDGSRMDMPSLVAGMGHKAFVYGTKKRRVPHTHNLTIPGIEYGTEVSQTLQNIYVTHSTALTTEMMKENFEYFRKHATFATISAIICSFPASCEMFLPFNKSIIFAPAHRYNLGRCTVDSWTTLNRRIIKMREHVSPEHFITAMSTYDVEYMMYYTGQRPALLESSSAGYVDHIIYTGTNPIVLMMGHTSIAVPGIEVRTPDFLYKRWDITQLAAHRAIIYMPYSVMSYKFTELYAMSIPLFVPSLKYFNEYASFGADRACNDVTGTLDIKMKRHPNSSHPYSPNVVKETDMEAEMYWLQFSDFYIWPHVTQFDSVDDLAVKINNANMLLIHQSMVIANIKRRKATEATLCSIMQRIVPSRMPTTVEEGMAPYN